MTLQSLPEAPAPARDRARIAAVTALAAVAVIAVVVAGTRLDHPGAAPSAAGPRAAATRAAATFPVGPPLRTYVDGRGVLHLDGVTEPGTDWKHAITTGDLTVGYRGAPDSGRAAVFVATTEVGSIERLALDEVQVSPDARTIAWVAIGPDGATGAIVVARVSGDGVLELGRLPVRTLLLGVDDEARERLLSVGDDHTVTYGGVVGGHSWRPGSRPVPADIAAYEYGPAGFPSQGQDVQLNRARTWGAWLADPPAPALAGEPVPFTAVAFQEVGDRRTRTRIAMPARDADLQGLFWESETDVILTVHDRTTQEVRYLRCNVLERSCEHAPAPGTG